MRKTIGTNPLDAVVPSLPSREEATQSGHSTRAGHSTNGGAQSGTTARNKSQNSPTETTATEEDAPNLNKKERLTVHITVGLVERCKNAVYWTPGLTLAGMGEQAFERVVTELEKKNGGPFEQRPEELKGGRPMK